MSLDSLESLMAQLHAVATVSDDDQVKNAFPIHDLEVEKVIKKALAGKTRIHRVEGDGLAAFRVRYADTDHASKRRVIPEGYMTVQQAAERLMTYRAVVDRLMDIGRLTTMPWHGGSQRLIEIASLEAFDREFVLVGALAKQHGLNSTNLAEKLQSFGVSAVMGPEIDGGLVKGFRRLDVAGVDFGQVKSLKGYQTRTGRRKKQ